MNELIQLVANWKVITRIETANGNQRTSRVNQQTILNQLYHGKHHPYLLPVEYVLPCDYILTATPALSSPFCPRGREFIDRGQALDFIDELFQLGRRLRRSKSQSREFVRRMTYAWAVSLNLDNEFLEFWPHTQSVISALANMTLGVLGIAPETAEGFQTVTSSMGHDGPDQRLIRPLAGAESNSQDAIARLQSLGSRSELEDQELLPCLASPSPRAAIRYHSWSSRVSIYRTRRGFVEQRNKIHHNLGPSQSTQSVFPLGSFRILRFLHLN
jgi:hypothetical protein